MSHDCDRTIDLQAMDPNVLNHYLSLSLANLQGMQGGTVDPPNTTLQVVPQVAQDPSAVPVQNLELGYPQVDSTITSSLEVDPNMANIQLPPLTPPEEQRAWPELWQQLP